MKFLILNGPNINMIGTRERHIYGNRAYADIMQDTRRALTHLGVSCDIAQSNHEGELIDRVQKTPGVYDGVLLNAGALTHTSYALRDAIAGVTVPFAEVHLTDIMKREPFRQLSVIADVCPVRVMGLGEASYTEAARRLRDYIRTTPKEDTPMSITSKQIAAMLDHSTLQPFLTLSDVEKGCETALKYQTATVCARPSDMKTVARILNGSAVKPCTVIGFPHGAHTQDTKLYESARALDDGCKELDMVMAIGRMLAGEEAYVHDEIAAICALAHSRDAIVKVIIETCMLSDAQKAAACRISEQAGADFVKTSTGYGASGATVEDIRLMRASVGPHVRVKASGGIRTLDAVLALREAGADRCGVSATEKIMQEAIARGL